MISLPHSLRTLLKTVTWDDYERGLLSQADCYQSLSTQFSIPAEDIARALRAATGTLSFDATLIALLFRLKKAHNLTVVAMSNISAPDWDILRLQPMDWSIFDFVFTSAAAGARKPDRPFYEHVLSSTGIDPHRAIFVDDKLENVSAARELGMHGFVYSGFWGFAQRLEGMFSGPISGAWRYLESRAGAHQTVTSTGVKIDENFAQLLILEATDKR